MLTAGTGLGKDSQGRVDTIGDSKQLGRHGLGFEVTGLVRERVEDQEIEKVNAALLHCCTAALRPTPFALQVS